MTSARHTASLAMCLLAAGACQRGPDDLATVDSERGRGRPSDSLAA